MSVPGKKKIVILGMMTRMPVAGVVWQTIHYVLGFEKLGYETYYVEEHGTTPVMFMQTETDDCHGKAAKFISEKLGRFGFDSRWAYRAVHAGGRVYGLSEMQLKTLYKDAALIINLHGGTVPQPEHHATNRLVYLETDPVEVQIQLFQNNQATIDYLAPHCAFFSFGENYGRPGCKLPVSSRFHFKPTRQPVICDLWEPAEENPQAPFTTVGNWEQPVRVLRFRGERYHWSKHFEFLKFIDLPKRTNQPLELALSSYKPEDQAMLEGKGWRVRPGLDVSLNIDHYRDYIRQSRGEFTVAKDQNIRLRSGWFSDRSATYLAAGRPVITQETGFEHVLPTGMGLFAFATMEEILEAIEAINANYAKHSRAARAVARDYFNYDVVLKHLLSELGV